MQSVGSSSCTNGIVSQNGFIISLLYHVSPVINISFLMFGILDYIILVTVSYLLV